MKLIDEELGGTTPLDIVLKFPKKAKKMKMMMIGMKKKQMTLNIGLQE